MPPDDVQAKQKAALAAVREKLDALSKAKTDAEKAAAIDELKTLLK
jgi:hypothetical protein